MQRSPGAITGWAIAVKNKKSTPAQECAGVLCLFKRYLHFVSRQAGIVERALRIFCLPPFLFVNFSL